MTGAGEVNPKLSAVEIPASRKRREKWGTLCGNGARIGGQILEIGKLYGS
jgi:hypothetical protein